MKHTRLLSILLAICLLFALPVCAENDPAAAEAPSAATEPTQAAAPGKLTVEAKAAMLVELNSDTILFEQNADEKVYPASLTKIMTCLLALENGNLSDTLTVTESALADLSEDGSTADLQVGEKMTLENILYCMMISSANEACTVVAEYIAGSTDAFVAIMNKRAGELGCTGTHFANPHGLHDDEHYTTVRDLSLIVRQALTNNEFKAIVSTYQYTVPATNLSGERRLTTTNRLINPTGGNTLYYPNASGVKTGFTSQAGRCLISTADNGDLSLLSLVCGCETVVLPSGDLEFESFPETIKMLDYGFDSFTYQTVLTSLYPVAEIHVSRSSGANFVSLAPKNEITALMPAGFDPNRVKLETTLINEKGVTAPVAAGDELGTVTVSYDGKDVGSTPLIAIADVSRGGLGALLGSNEHYTTQTWLRVLLTAIIVLFFVIVIVLLLNRRRRRRYRERQRKLRLLRKEQEKKDAAASRDWFTKE